MEEAQEMWVLTLGWEDPLKEEMATHSSILPSKSHGQRTLASYCPWGHKESDMTKLPSTRHCLEFLVIFELGHCIFTVHWAPQITWPQPAL